MVGADFRLGQRKQVLGEALQRLKLLRRDITPLVLLETEDKNPSIPLVGC
jgi:hypothetical protein